MTQHHKDKNGKELRVGSSVHFEVDGRPYSGIVHELVRRDHEPAISTMVMLMLPASQVSTEAPAKKDRVDPKHEKKDTDQKDSGDEKPHAHPESADPPKMLPPRDEHDHRTEPKDTTPQGEKNAEDTPSAARHQSEATAHSNQQQPKPAEPNRGSTLAEPKKGSK